VNDAMAAEFDTMATWTADAATSLGRAHYLPAACRGSGSPATLQWLIDQLGITASDRMLDCGAGVGGPAAFAADRVGVRPVLTDPEPGACQAARRLFGLPTVRAGSDLPFQTATFDVAWCLGVLCTVTDQDHLLAELRRVLTPVGRLGLLIFVATQSPLSDAPPGNNFPTQQHLRALLAHAGLKVAELVPAIDLSANPPSWNDRAQEVEAELRRRHGHDPSWLIASEQSERIGRMLADGALIATIAVVSPTVK
jgi:ubiquinone/menaquinone biosynthesis C-methylase UbiE